MNVIFSELHLFPYGTVMFGFFLFSLPNLLLVLWCIPLSSGELSKTKCEYFYESFLQYSNTN